MQRHITKIGDQKTYINYHNFTDKFGHPTEYKWKEKRYFLQSFFLLSLHWSEEFGSIQMEVWGRQLLLGAKQDQPLLNLKLLYFQLKTWSTCINFSRLRSFWFVYIVAIEEKLYKPVESESKSKKERENFSVQTIFCKSGILL